MSRLPPALLDLMLSRAFARVPKAPPWCKGLSLRRSASAQSRHGHSAAALARPPQDMDVDVHSLYSRRKEVTARNSGQENMMQAFEDQNSAVVELEERIRALKETLQDEDAFKYSESYSEHELLQLYEDLLSFPSLEPAQTVESRDLEKEDAVALHGVIARLLDPSEPVASSSAVPDSGHGFKEIIARLQEITNDIARLQLTPPSTSAEAQNTDELTIDVPTGILATGEWLALTRTCLRADDVAAAETTLILMKEMSGLGLEEVANEVLSSYAATGDVANTERLLKTYAPAPSEVQRDLHVKAYCKSLTLDTFPDQVETLLHTYESRGTPAPMKSYTRALVALLATHNRPALARAQAQDLYAHMRYAVHLQPDMGLYAVMIRSCSHPSMPAEPERALDLFTEATIERRLEPTHGVYSATIFALARSGERHYVLEAFRLAKQMLDGYRDARGRNLFRPDQRIVSALLEGAKRIGDLGRARWILAVMVRETTEADTNARAVVVGGGDTDATVLLSEAIMKHVFHAYASYKVPFVPSMAKLVEDYEADAAVAAMTGSRNAPAESSNTPQEKIAKEMEEDFATSGLPTAVDNSVFTHIPPQSRADLIREVDILFWRIVEDNKIKNDLAQRDLSSTEDVPMPGPFQHVALTTRLLNAYLSVHYAHSQFEVYSELFRTLFKQVNVPRNAMTYIDALERLANMRKDMRGGALRLAEEIWGIWQSIEGAWLTRLPFMRDDPAVSTVNARLIERANAAMIRILTLAGRGERAFDLVQAFARRYPPERLLDVTPKHPLRSTSTILDGPRPLVRLSSNLDIPDDVVPPLLTFTDFEIMHQHFVKTGNEAAIRYIKWLSKAYEGALRRRRDATVAAAPSKSRGHKEKVPREVAA